MGESAFKTEGERLLWQAHKKADLISRRELRQFLEGKIDYLPCSGDRRDREIIRVIDAALSKPLPPPPAREGEG